MRDFFANPWPAPRRPAVFWHPSEHALEPLLRAYGSIVGEVEPLTPVAPQWLHATLVCLPVDSAVLAPAVWERLGDEVAQAAARHAPFQLTAGPALCTTGGVVLDLVSDRHWSPLVIDVHTAMVDVLGGDIVPGIAPRERPHVSLAYSRAATDSGPVQAALRRATDQRSPLQVDRIDLIDLEQDPHNGTFTWQVVRTAPLTGSGQS